MGRTGPSPDPSDPTVYCTYTSLALLLATSSLLIELILASSLAVTNYRLSPVDHSMIRTFYGGTVWIWSTLKIFLRQRTEICRRKGKFLTQRKWICVSCVLSIWVVLDDLDDIEATELADAPGKLTWKSVSDILKLGVILNFLEGY